MSEVPQPVDRETAHEYAERQRLICEFLRSNNITSASEIMPQFLHEVYAHVIACAEEQPHKPISGLPELDEY